MHVLGLDPSLTNFGWALHDTEAQGLARCLDRGRFQTSRRTLYIDRYTDLRASVLDLVARTGVKNVGCEYPIFNDLYSEGMYGLFLFTSEALRASKVNLVFFSPPQVKAHARDFLARPLVDGKLWTMQKGDMVEAAREDTGGTGQWNHNEADAYWVARAAGRFWSYLNGDITDADLTPPERSQFTKIHTFTRGKRAGRTAKTGIAYREDERFFRWAQEDINGDEEEDGVGDRIGEVGSDPQHHEESPQGGRPHRDREQ